MTMSHHQTLHAKRLLSMVMQMLFHSCHWGVDEKFNGAEPQDNLEVSHTILEEIQAFPLDLIQIKRATQNDDTLQKVIRWIREGWPTNKPTQSELQLLWAQRESLVFHDNIIILQRDTN